MSEETRYEKLAREWILEWLGPSWTKQRVPSLAALLERCARERQEEVIDHDRNATSDREIAGADASAQTRGQDDLVLRALKSKAPVDYPIVYELASRIGQLVQQVARLEKERDEAMSALADTHTVRFVEVEQQRDHALATASRLREALIEFVELHGGAHERDCPEDDTCDCKHKSSNDRVNAALAETADVGSWLEERLAAERERCAQMTPMASGIHQDETGYWEGVGDVRRAIRALGATTQGDT